jgi:putative phosphoribosyl transferase
MGSVDSSEYVSFADREDAARKLVQLLQDLKGQEPLVLGIPRGSVPMARAIADAIGGDLDIVLVKKLGHPSHSEFAIGSVTESGEIALGPGAKKHGITLADVAEQAKERSAELKRKRQLYTPGKKNIDPKNRTAVIVDDGIATGATMSAAVKHLRDGGAKKVIVVAPVASRQAVSRLRDEGAEVRVLAEPEDFRAVSLYYDDFPEVTDEEIQRLLSISQGEIILKRGPVELKAILTVPASPTGTVVFAHGSGSGRLSPRNQYVADVLNRHGQATILADLLTENESEDRANVFDIELLASRLVLISEWLRQDKRLKSVPFGFFGASTGGGAALVAAAKLGNQVAAVVSRGGRPDLAGEALGKVKVPTLLIVGGNDGPVVSMNQSAFEKLKCEKRLEIVPGATHLFEEEGALEKVAFFAADWFGLHFSAGDMTVGRRRE